MVVQIGSVSLPFYKHAKGWRFSYKDPQGRWKYVTRKDKADAMERARKKARELHNGSVDIGALPPDKASLVHRFLALDISHADLDAWLDSRNRHAVLVSVAVKEFLEAKKLNRGRSYRNLGALTGDLNSLTEKLGTQNLSSITVADLEGWLLKYKDVSPIRRRGLRGSCVTFFRWARKRDYLPDATTAAEKLERPLVPRTIPVTWTPAEMRVLLQHCPSSYLPWLVLSGFAGMRQEELIIDPRSDKSPLDWSDFHWKRKIISVRPETSKNNESRIIPILPVVRAWLYAMCKESGPTCPASPPSKIHGKDRTSVTKSLGAHFKGWRNNALRHSFISYRAAIVGLSQTAMEAGNSESEARRSYNDAKGKDDARKWFAITPQKVPKRNSSEP